MRRFSPFRCVAVLIALSLGAPLAWADQIDVDLSKRGPRLVEQIRKRQYKNVGVLNFQVQREDGPVNMHAGRLNVLLATRLENVLILELLNYKEVRPGIVCGAGKIAAEKAGATYLTEEGRAQLFKRKYPLAWGNEEVPVNAFLTGVVRFSRDMKEANVIIQVIDDQDPSKLQKLMEFTTPTTLAMLGDMGMVFSLRGPAKEDETPAGKKLPDVSRINMSAPILTKLLPTKAGPPEVAKQDDALKDDPLDVLKKSLRFEVFYDNESQGQLGRGFSPPKLNQVVHFEVTNLTPKTLGIVLRVNGINTADNDRRVKDPQKYARWILEPNKSYSIYGFYEHRKNAKEGAAVNAVCVPFKAGNFKQLEDNPDLAIDTKLGKIELDVFVKGVEIASAAGQRSLAEPAIDESGERATTYTDLYKRVADTAARAVVLPPESSRELILPDPKNTKEVNLNWQPFTGNILSHYEIQYTVRAERK
jgi:hypothetical protein